MVRLLVFAISPILWATEVGADRYSDCNQSADPDRSISGCTAIIQRGKRENQKNKAVAYWSRGNTYYLKREVDKAIADYTQAIKLNPE
ncbi:MAG: tetratricopeptide repeat protein, partial [Hyphomicrobium sp.]